MRFPVILALSPALVLILVAPASSEVIHLKNGRTIWAEQVREKGTQIEYDVGDDTYAIPKSLVDRIESGGSSPQSGSGAQNSRDLPAFHPADPGMADSAGLAGVIRDGHPDDGELSRLEALGNPKTTSVAYFLAGKNEFDHGNFPKARNYLETALRSDGENPSILNYYAALLVKTGHAAEALPYAEHAVRIAPDSPDTLTVLGYVQYAADRDREAIRTWKHSLELRPDATVAQLLAKAERDATVQAGYSERESNHFTLHYEGEQTSDALRSQILAALESDYDDLVRQLGVAPRNSIAVVLYTSQTFFDVTQAPSWSGAINDGKLRIPTQGLNSVTPELARVLKHELTHSFVNQLSAGRCPQWLNEGLAQLFEPKAVAHGRDLAALYRAQQEIPLNMLEGSFAPLSPTQATLAYEESLAATQYISETSGLDDLRRILERLGQGSSSEAALRTIVHSDYGQLETEVGKYILKKYGN
jgi:tetratricopeptide (TPR) repeat protein